MLALRQQSQMPKILSRLADVEIPRSAWSAWKPADGQRGLRRPLTTDERQALESRRSELEPWVTGYHPSEGDDIALALLDMFGSFPSMRQSAGEAAARVDAARRLLVPYPAWAIVKACQAIQGYGVFRDGSFDRQWPPSDAELIDSVRQELKIYKSQYQSAIALLEATHETDKA
jgi:hypothetical protein